MACDASFIRGCDCWHGQFSETSSFVVEYLFFDRTTLYTPDTHDSHLFLLVIVFLQSVASGLFLTVNSRRPWVQKLGSDAVFHLEQQPWTNSAWQKFALQTVQRDIPTTWNGGSGDAGFSMRGADFVAQHSDVGMPDGGVYPHSA